MLPWHSSVILAMLVHICPLLSPCRQNSRPKARSGVRGCSLVLFHMTRAIMLNFCNSCGLYWPRPVDEVPIPSKRHITIMATSFESRPTSYPPPQSSRIGISTAQKVTKNSRGVDSTKPVNHGLLCRIRERPRFTRSFGDTWLPASAQRL